MVSLRPEMRGRAYASAMLTGCLLTCHAWAREPADATTGLSRDIVFNVAADDGGADGLIRAQLEINAPSERVWTVMLDCNRALKFLTALKSCKVLETSRDGLTDVREHRSRWIAFLPETVSVFRSLYTPTREIKFERISGDFRVLKGHWLLEPLNDGMATRIIYEARVGIDMPIPGFLIRAALEEDVPRFLAAFRDEVEAMP